jgi:hypothetical protein
MFFSWHSLFRVSRVLSFALFSRSRSAAATGPLRWLSLLPGAKGSDRKLHAGRALDRPAGRLRLSGVLLAISLLALLAFAVWSRRPLLREGLWRDEAISVYVASSPSVPELIRRNQISDYNPPLFNLLLAGYGRLVGFDEGPLKGFALAWSLLAMVGVALLAREIAGKAAALVAGALAVNDPLLIQMSGELRSYSLSAFLCVLCLLLALRMRFARDGIHRGGENVALGLSLILLAYSHIAGALVVAALGVWGTLEWVRRSPFGRRLVTISAAAGIAFLFWLPTAWRQFRIGLPWENALALAQRLHSLGVRSRGALIAPDVLAEPSALIGLAILGTVSLLARRELQTTLRARAIPLVVTCLAGIVVWLTLGVFSQQNRYLAIPAALSCVLVASLLGCVLDAARGRPWLGTLALVGILGVAVAAFLARGELYGALSERRSQPKSGIRTLCREHPPRADQLLVAAPDYLAPTIWYYCGGKGELHGFVRWKDPVLFDPREYAVLWRSPDAARRTLLQIEEALHGLGQARFEFVWENAPAGPPLFYSRRIRALRELLSEDYDELRLGQYVGRIESVNMSILSARRP